MNVGFDLGRAFAAPRNIPVETLAAMLACADADFESELFAAASELKRRLGKDKVLPRGLIECSNVCSKDCLYCGIRRSNGKVTRYRLPEAEVFAALDEARRRGYPAVAFQAGEIESEENTRYYERLLGACRDLEVTLSLGEQEEGVYRRWKEAGALRYLIRIETSNRELYARLHPPACSFDRRVGCIRALKRLGYVTGTGVMIGLPGQTAEDLARDIVFFGDERVDMVGMGPFISHPETPMGEVEELKSAEVEQLSECGEGKLRLALRMIALTRLYLHDVNIVAATALEALDPKAGRAHGLAAGANVIMPNLTTPSARQNYNLYPGKVAAS